MNGKSARNQNNHFLLLQLRLASFLRVRPYLLYTVVLRLLGLLDSLTQKQIVVLGSCTFNLHYQLPAL